MNCEASNCGWDCEIFLDGECKISEEFVSDNLTGYQIDILYDLYDIEDSSKWLEED